MTEPFDVAAGLRELHASGFTWPEVARLTGASSGDYARKVASGAKPGRNIAGNVQALLTTGRQQAPAPRRTDKAGRLARVRGSAATGSRRPPPPPPAVTASSIGDRQLYRAAGSRRVGWTRAFDFPELNHPDGRPLTGAARRRALEGRRVSWFGVLDELRATARGQARGGARRVSFTVTARNPETLQLETAKIGGRGGYAVSDVLRQMRQEGVLEWLAHQLEGRNRTSGSPISDPDPEDIVSVTVEVAP